MESYRGIPAGRGHVLGRPAAFFLRFGR